MITDAVKQSLLKNDAVVFHSDYGKKGVEESWSARLKQQIKNIDQFKQFQNINIITGGDSRLVDIDLDCSESLILADYFLNDTGMVFGRSTTPRSHRIYKVIDLNKKHTRTTFEFDGEKKLTLVEIRANKHYTMCGGQYENGDTVEWQKTDAPVEITYDTLKKQVSKLAVALSLIHI